MYAFLAADADERFSDISVPVRCLHLHVVNESCVNRVLPTWERILTHASETSFDRAKAPPEEHSTNFACHFKRSDSSRRMASLMSCDSMEAIFL